MSHVTVGIVDYGMGNHASVFHCLVDLGFKVKVSSKPAELDLMDLLLLPGVGAFPAAMANLANRGLVDYLKIQVRRGRPLIGICLGMQLLASCSREHTYTVGLDIIPGEIVPFDDLGVHIGWNTLKFTQRGPLWSPSDQDTFYFNHSFCYHGPVEYLVATTEHSSAFSSIIQRNNVVGLQFHPEKSQSAGKLFLRKLILGMAHA